MKSYSYQATLAGISRRGVSTISEPNTRLKQQIFISMVRKYSERVRSAEASIIEGRVTGMKFRFPPRRLAQFDFYRIDRFINRICRAYKCPRQQVLRATRAHADCRQAICYWMARVFDMNATEIASVIRKDHSTVLHAVRTHAARRGCRPVSFRKWLSQGRLHKEMENPLWR